MCRNRPEATRNGISSETPYRLCGGGKSSQWTTKRTPEDMEYIYTNLGNGINHELCMKFVKSGYDLKVIEESV